VPEIGIGREDREPAPVGHGAEEKIKGRSLDAMASAERVKFGGGAVVVSIGQNHVEPGKSAVELLELLPGLQPGKQFLIHEARQNDAVFFQHLFEKIESRMFDPTAAPQKQRPDGSVNENHGSRGSSFPAGRFVVECLVEVDSPAKLPELPALHAFHETLQGMVDRLPFRPESADPASFVKQLVVNLKVRRHTANLHIRMCESSPKRTNAPAPQTGQFSSIPRSSPFKGKKGKKMTSTDIQTAAAGSHFIRQFANFLN
jgi:hypothetical protein